MTCDVIFVVAILEIVIICMVSLFPLLEHEINLQNRIFE